MKYLITIIIILTGFVGDVFSQAIGDYRSAASGTWGTRANWVRWNGTAWVTPTSGQGAPSTTSNAITILNIHTMTVAANVSVDQLTVNSGGAIVVNATRILTIANIAGTDLTNNGTITNAGTITVGSGAAISNSGTINNNNLFYINGTLTNNSGGVFNENYTTNVGYTSASGTFINSAGANLNILASGYFYLGNTAARIGTLTNAGTVTNACPSSTYPGILLRYGTITNSGTLTNNSGTYFLSFSGTTVTNSSTGTITNNGAATFNGSLINNGIYNERYLTSLGYAANATLTNAAGANFNIQSTGASTGGQLYIGSSLNGFTGTVNNSGTITNGSPDASAVGLWIDYGTLTVTNTLTNSSGCTILNDYYGAVNIDGTLNNNGIYQEYGSTTVGYSSAGAVFNNNSGATYTLYDLATAPPYGPQLYIGNGVSGTFNNAGMLINDMTHYDATYASWSDIVVANGSLNNTGTIENNGGYWTTTSGISFLKYGLVCSGASASISNSGTITNTGAIGVSSSAVFNNNAAGTYSSSSFTIVNSTFNNYGIFNENFETFIITSGVFNNKSGANVNISSSSTFCFSSAGASLTNDAGATISNYGTGTIQGLYLATSTSITNNGSIIDEGNILIDGTFTNNGSFTYKMNTGSITGANYITYGASSALTYLGSSAQTSSNYELPSASLPNTVTINNASGVNLHASKSVGSLVLTSGSLNLGGNTLTVTNSAASGISRTSGYILSNSTDLAFNSRLQWNIGSSTGAHVFPFGVDASTYVPFTFDLKSGNIGNVVLSTYQAGTAATTASGLYANKPAIITNLDGDAGTGNPGNAENVVKRFWLIEPTGTGTVDVTYTYAESEIPVTGESSDMVAQRYNTTTNKWEAPLSPQTNNTTSNTITVTGVTSFSPWAIARKPNPLPIELISFDGICTAGKVNLQWSTASELNNDYFTIERSSDFELWQTVGIIQGAGTSNSVNSYSFTDFPENTANYYRLKQTDFDGTEVSFDPIMVNCLGENENVFEVAAVNYNGENILVSINISTEELLNIELYDYKGSLVSQLVINSNEGLNMVSVPVTGFNAGLYLINISSSSKKISEKFLVD